jgi:1-phosphofructokinase
MSGSVTTNVDKNIYYTLTKALIDLECKVILDADGELFDDGVKAIPTLIKPNSFELCQYFGVEETTDTNTLVELAKRLMNTGIEYVVISLGGDGALFLNEKGIYRVEALKVSVGSTVGAGDAMVAGLTKALAENYGYIDMIKLAVGTSAGAVTTKGTGSADLDVIMDLVKLVKVIKV